MSATRLPVPLQMKLPSASWHRIDPEVLSIAPVGLLAVRAVEKGEYVPTLIVDGEVREGDFEVEKLADEVVTGLRDQCDHAGLVKRRESRTDNSSSILQLIEIEEQRDGRRFDLQQVQVLQAIQDLAQPARRYLLTFTMISEFKKRQQLQDEFSDFMDSVSFLSD